MTIQSSILHNLPGLHARLDVNGRIIDISDDHAKNFGFKSAYDLLDHERTLYDVRTKVVELADVFYKEEKQLIKADETLKIVCFCDCGNGPGWYFGTKQLIHDDTGAPKATIHNFINITGTEVQKYFEHMLLKSQNNQWSYTLTSTYNKNLLSTRESECLFYILRGKTAGIIAKILNLSKRTVETYLENIKIKFNCDNRSQLIEKALDLGYYHIIPKSILQKKHYF